MKGESSPPPRRSLSFDDLDQVVHDVRLLAAGCRTLGNWSLAQTCKHLADTIKGSMDGFDLRRHRVKRLLFHRQMLRMALTKGIPRDYTVDPGVTPGAGVSLEPAMEELRRAIDRYQAHRGELCAHPLFGMMPREVWNRVHCVHCAHHLSLVIPDRTTS